jgi:hypothetical protein
MARKLDTSLSVVHIIAVIIHLMLENKFINKMWYRNSVIVAYTTVA